MDGQQTYSLELLINLFRTMLRIRLCEEGLVDSILKGEIQTPCHLYSGEEAIAAGVCASLTNEDYIFGTHRSHGHFLAKGGSMKELIGEIYCRETGCSRGRGGSMHLVDPEKGFLGAAPIVAGTISLALGAALGASLRKEKRVAVAFFGDGATGEGVLYESMNFASLKRLPIIFACENNLYATHMPLLECRVSPDIYKIAEPFCIKTQVVDGNNVLAVYEAGKAAVAHCRTGEGPVFMEFKTYRFRGHVGPDDNIQGNHTDIRPKIEIEQWMQRDPIVLFEKYLMEGRFLEADALKLMREEAEREVAMALDCARNSSRPRKEELTAYVHR
jgi:TPP-dependent pyruvate/acetoin dehydrogenase alpha subunit